MSRFIRFSFFAGFSLAALLFALVLSGGNIIPGVLWGIVPVWFWATYQKLKADNPIGQLEGVAAYVVVLFGGVLALFSLLFLFSSFAISAVDAEVIQAAVEQQPNFDDFNEEELKAMDMVVKQLPTIMPILSVVLGVMATSYIGYGLAVVRKYSS